MISATCSSLHLFPLFSIHSFFEMSPFHSCSALVCLFIFPVVLFLPFSPFYSFYSSFLNLLFSTRLCLLPSLPLFSPPFTPFFASDCSCIPFFLFFPLHISLYASSTFVHSPVRASLITFPSPPCPATPPMTLLPVCRPSPSACLASRRPLRLRWFITLHAAVM